MRLRYAPRVRPLLAVLAATILAVALACGGEEPTNTPAPTATTAPPTATAAPTPTEVPAEPTATLRPGQPTNTPAPTDTPVPETATDDYRDDWVNFLLEHRGYKPEWGEPQYGGIYKTAEPRPASRFQTTLGYGAFSRWQFSAHNSLMMMDPWGAITDSPICDLCESFEISADGLTYTFVLRDNVKFHEEGWAKEQGAPGFGTELACEDIKASMEWFANPPPETRASYIKTGEFIMGHLDEVSCPDGAEGKTAVLNFDRVRNGTLGWLAAGIAVWDKDYREWMDAEYPGIQSTAVPEGFMINMGTGPFIPLSANSQTVMKSRTNPNYWLTGAPFIDGMDNFAIQDYNTKFAALLTGKIHQAGHGSSGITKAQVQQVQDQYSDTIELQIVRYNHQQHFLLNHLRPPFDDWNVRHAVQLALDREDWLRFTTVGAVKMGDPYLVLHSDAGWGIPIEEFQTFPGMNPATKDADLAEANRILDEVFGPGVRPRTDQYVRELLSRREVSLWGLDFFKKHLNWEFDVQYVDSYGNIQTECLYTIRSEASPTYGQSYIEHAIDGLWKVHSQWHGREDCRDNPGWTNDGPIPAAEWAKLDAKIEELDVTQDRARGEEIVRELELYLYESAVHTPLGIMNVAWPNRWEAKGVRYYNLGTYSQQRLHDRIWLVE
ncbi:MAG: ABC transporter substrate-binding protein [Chloroflexota bacterium]|nr:ABC transporter substrate-binding protein [Chloroflexota bacterium]MDE2941235.1 ABC transporter substrate-binding protein [Chloroflexota bacterium]MDE3267181.1 ABC transporter substrate-binding protein [Chloroflexota bacterium]